MATLIRARVQTTHTNGGRRLFRERDVVFDADRIERNFVPADGSRPAQSRIHVHDGDVIFPALITSVLAYWERCCVCGHHAYLSHGQSVCDY